MCFQFLRKCICFYHMDLCLCTQCVINHACGLPFSTRLWLFIVLNDLTFWPFSKEFRFLRFWNNTPTTHNHQITSMDFLKWKRYHPLSKNGELKNFSRHGIHVYVGVLPGPLCNCFKWPGPKLYMFLYMRYIFVMRCTSHSCLCTSAHFKCMMRCIRTGWVCTIKQCTQK